MLLYGQLRTFFWTRTALARMASLASSDCAFTIAVTDEKICDPDAQHPGKCLPLGGSKFPIEFKKFASSV